MKTLYISDLDGTLLNQNAELSPETIELLNTLTANGICFSVATARTAATCERILEKVQIPIPIVLMNGVLVYDLAQKQYIKKELLSREKVDLICHAIESSGITGFMYTLPQGKLATYYTHLTNHAMRAFMEERIQKYNKPFTKVPLLRSVDAEILYFCFIDTYERIHTLYEMIQNIPGIRIEKYQDIYSDENLWYMEVFADTASKYNAVLFLREHFRFEKVIAFGDNLNDLPLFAASDFCYAVGNAKEEVKAAANAIIGKNTENSVAKEIARLELSSFS